MLCKKPWIVGAAMPVPCQRCLPCRFNKRRVWAFRILLESLKHEHSSFITLTYSPKHLPDGGTLVRSHTQKFFKEIRRSLPPRSLRYVVVGEYGDVSFRPHYHAACFGLSAHHQELVQEAWSTGFVHIGDLNPHSSQYLFKYVVKRMTSRDDPRLQGRLPEFMQPSLKPGIGALAVPDLGNTLSDGNGFGASEISTSGDVPISLRLGPKSQPLGRYLRQQLRKELGFKNTGGQIEIITQMQVQAVQMYEDALKKPENKNRTWRQILMEMNAQKCLNLEAKAEIYKQRTKL